MKPENSVLLKDPPLTPHDRRCDLRPATLVYLRACNCKGILSVDGTPVNTTQFDMQLSGISTSSYRLQHHARRAHRRDHYQGITQTARHTRTIILATYLTDEVSRGGAEGGSSDGGGDVVAPVAARGVKAARRGDGGLAAGE